MVGIGLTPSTNRLEVNGDASKTTAGSWLANSDRRLKRDIFGLTNALEKIRQLRPVKFKYTPQHMADNPSIQDRFYYNFIAQEFQQVFPNHVKDDGRGYLQVDTYPVRPFLVKGMQELMDIVDRQEGAISALRAEISALRARQSTGNGTAILTSQQSQIDELTALVNRLLEQRRVAEDNDENDDNSDDDDQNQQ